jgi:hypothetical protein
MKTLSTILFFNKGFNTNFITTIGETIYVPNSKINAYWLWQIICHEFIHLLNARKCKLWFGLKYIFPQILAVFSLLSFCGGLWLLNLLWLLTLAPIPAYFRMKEEMDGYTMTMFVEWYMNQNIGPILVGSIAKNFYGPNYYWMWPFRNNIEKRLVIIAYRIMDGQFDNIYPYSAVKKIINEEKTN